MPAVVPRPSTSTWPYVMFSGFSVTWSETVMNATRMPITTTLFRIGVHIGAAKCPRVLSTAPRMPTIPKKNTSGSNRYASEVTSSRSAGPWLSLAITAVSSGAAATASTVAAPRMITASVSSRWVNA